MIDKIILKKIDYIKKCISRIVEEFDKNFRTNLAKQDSVVLNLKKISQATIDIATHIVRVKKLGIPKTSKEIFSLLENFDYISKETSSNMQKMIGFRNIAVYDYQNLSIDIVVSIVENHLDDFVDFSNEVLKR